MDQHVIDDLKTHIESLVGNVLFEFNDDKTRYEFRASLFPYISNLVQDGYEIEHVCDESNNTDDVINNNEFCSDIYIKKDGSWRCIHTVVKRTGISFDETRPVE